MQEQSDITEAIASGRLAFERHQWPHAYAQLSSLPSVLGADDLERVAVSAHLIGRDGESEQIWAQAHARLLAAGSVERAVRCAYWIGFLLLIQGESARSRGWLARARRLLDDAKRDCVEQGYLLVPSGLQMLWMGDPGGACATFEHVYAIAQEFNDPDLMAIGLLGRGQALIGMGEADKGVALLDEVMVAATSGDLSPCPLAFSTARLLRRVSESSTCGAPTNGQSP